MQNARYPMDVFRHAYQHHEIYLTVAFRGGCTTRDYQIGETAFRANYAFYHLFFEYLDMISGGSKYHFRVQRALSTISLQSDPQRYVQEMSELIDLLMSRDFSEVVFARAKARTLQSFCNRCKDGSFRAEYMAYEYADPNKRFRLQALMDDLTMIDFYGFCRCVRMLITPSNLYVSVVGSADPDELRDFYSLLPPRSGNGKDRIAVQHFDPHLRQNAHILSPASENIVLNIISIHFLNQDLPLQFRILLVEILSQTLSREAREVWVDEQEASLIVPNDSSESFKHDFASISEDEFEVAKKHLSLTYIFMLRQKAMSFGIRAATLFSVGVRAEHYIKAVDHCSYAQFKRLLSRADYRMTEAQLVLRKA